jgi:hypothetical protein
MIMKPFLMLVMEYPDTSSYTIWSDYISLWGIGDPL